MEALAALPRHGFAGPGWQGSQKAGPGPCVYLLEAPGPWGQRAGTPRGPIRSSVCSAPPRPWQCRSHRCHGTLETASRHGCWPPGGPQAWRRVSGQGAESQPRRGREGEDHGGTSEGGRKGASEVGTKGVHGAKVDALASGPSGSLSPAEGTHLQDFVDGLAVHGLLVVGGLVESTAEGAQRHQLFNTHLEGQPPPSFSSLHAHQAPTTCPATGRVWGHQDLAPVLERTRRIDK